MFEWLKPKYSVCIECGALFYPVGTDLNRWKHWCAIHREAIMAKELKRDAVYAWVNKNLDRLAKQMEDEIAEERKAYQSSDAYKQQQTMMQNQMGQAAMKAMGGLGDILGKYGIGK